MSNVIAGVVRGQYPFLDEHIAQKKAIYERYKEGFKGLPVKMNPFNEDKCEPNYWLSAMIIDKEAMCKQVHGEQDALYTPEHRLKSWKRLQALTLRVVRFGSLCTYSRWRR